MVWVLFFISFLWGTTFIFSKIVVGAVSPSFIIMMRFLSAAFLFYLVFGRRVRLDVRSVIAGGVIGLVNGGAMILQVLGLKYTTASHSAFITAVYIVFVPVIEWIFWGKKPRARLFGGIGVTLAGVFLLSGIRAGFSVNPGDAITFLSGILFAFEIFLISHFGEKSDPFCLILVQFLATGATGALFSCLDGSLAYGMPLVMSGGRVMLSLAYLAVMGTFIPFMLQVFAQKTVKPTIAGMIYITESVFALLLAALFLGERMTVRGWVGIVCILAGIFVTVSRVRKRRGSSAAADLSETPEKTA